MTNGTQQPRLAAARSFLAAGWQPVPLLPREKRPFHSDWLERDFAAEGLERHFGGEGNIGLKCGELSRGLVDVDIDDVHALRIADTYLPLTPLCHGRPGNPKSHRWYLLSDTPGATLQFKDCDGTMFIELRSTGGQTMVPPSIHPSGDVLDWCDGLREPSAIERRELEKMVSKVAACALIARHWPEEGGRNEASLALAGMLLRGGMADDAAEEFVRAVAEAACDEEAEDRAKNVATTRKNLDEGRQITGYTRLAERIRSDAVASLASTWLRDAGVIGEATTWGAPVYFVEQTPPPIPAALLPGALGEFASALAAEAEVPEALPVMAVLGALSTALAKRVVVSPTQTWAEPVNIYTAVALPPGSNKSLVLNRCTAPLARWEANERQRLEPVIAAARSLRKSEELRIERERREAVKEKDAAVRANLFGQVAKAEAALQPVEAELQLFANDLTPEALAMTLSEQGGRLAIISDEGGIMETMAGLYTKGSANVDVLLKGIDGGHVRVRRKSGEGFDVNPYISMVLAVQPRILQNMAEKHAFRGNGMLERFLFVLPKSTLGYRSHKGTPVQKETEEAYGAIIDTLLALPQNVIGGTVVKAPILDDGGEGQPVPSIVGGTVVPYTLTLSSEAESAWSSFRGEVETMLLPTGKLAEATGWGGKLPGFTLRIAGLLHMAQIGTQTLRIDDTIMKSAIDLARLLIDHAVAARQLMGTDQATEDAKVVLEWLTGAQRDRFTRTECLEAHRSRLASTKRMEAMLAALADRNIIREGEKLSGAGGGRPAREYRVNPLIYAN